MTRDLSYRNRGDQDRRQRADHTTQIYRSRWDGFQVWCRNHGKIALPADPAVVVDYLTHLAATPRADGRPIGGATLRQTLAAITTIHRDMGLGNPVTSVRSDLASIVTRTEARTPPGRTPHVLRSDVEQIAESLRPQHSPTTTLVDLLRRRRDRLIVVLSYAGALSLGELVDLRVTDTEFAPPEHLVLRAASPDRRRPDRRIVLPRTDQPSMCPLCVWVDWVDALIAAEVGADALANLLADTDDADRHSCHGRRPRVAHVDPIRRLVCGVGKRGQLSTGRMSGINSILKQRADESGLPASTVEALSVSTLRESRLHQAYLDGVSYDDDAVVLGRVFYRVYPDTNRRTHALDLGL